MKIVHAFDYETRAYLGPHELNHSDMSPLEDGVYLVPGNCLEMSPPAPPAGMEVYARQQGHSAVWDLRAIVLPPEPEPDPIPTLDEAKALLKQRVTAQRWIVETSGITMPGGARVLTTIEDQNRISNATYNALRKGLPSVRFKNAEGVFIDLPVAGLVAIADAVSDHVQACFDAEAAHFAAVDVLDATTVGSYDVLAGWPGASGEA